MQSKRALKCLKRDSYFRKLSLFFLYCLKIKMTYLRTGGFPARKNLTNGPSGGAWVAQWVKRATSAQVMISRFLGSSLTSGSVLTARSLEPALASESPSLSLPLPHSSSVSLSLKDE